ncbi:MAG TPA: ATP-binding protein [Ruminiclostridium sp.]
MLYDVSEICFTALEGLIFVLAFAVLSYRRDFIFKSFIRVVIFVLIYTVYTYWVTLFLPSGLHTILVAFLTIITLNYVFSGAIIKSVMKFSMVFLGMTIIESIIAIVSMFILKLPLSDLIQNDLYMFFCSIIAKTFEIIALFILYKRNFNISWLNDNKPYQSKYKQLLIIISTVLFFLIFTNVFISNNPHNLFVYNIFSFVIYIVLIIAMLSAFREGSKLEIIQFASDLKKENIAQLIEFNEMVAKERHEYKNHLNTIYGLCTLHRPDMSDRIKQYINNYANNSLTQNIIIESGNDFVDAIINVKYNNALRKGIEVRVDFEQPLSVARINEDIAVTIISNVIDNAFESIIMVQQEKKYISLETYIENNIYFISISNNGPMISETDKKKIYNAGFSTKDNSAKNRGYGLSIVQTEINRCGGNIFINSSEEVTEFLISLQINEHKAVV